MVDQFLKYYEKAHMMQKHKYQKGNYNEQDIDDDLIWNVPIYDVVNRRYAAFSSLLEAIKADNDPKNNSIFFKEAKENISDLDFINLCYLFRLCGSGINYVPKSKDLFYNNEPFGTHGFGNFWVVDNLKNGILKTDNWIELVPDKGFCDVKGYMLPLIKGGLNNYIKKKSKYLMEFLTNLILSNKKQPIKKIVDKGNEFLISNGFQRQNFVLTAFAMDMAEYFPNNVDRNSDVYVGSNASKCLKLILPKMKHDSALRYLCDITGGYSEPYSMEDVACDFIRYKDNFQSPAHIKANKGLIFKNNL